MDQIKELEKYKTLLDEGAISEDEFRKLKQKLLGLKTDEEKEAEKQQERAQALAEIEKMRAEEAAKKEESERIEKQRLLQVEIEEKRREQELLARKDQEVYQKTFSVEKAKEQARLEAQREQEEKKRKEQMEKVQKSAKVATSVVAKVILWFVTVFCMFISIVLFYPSESVNNIYNIVSGFFFFVFAMMACPPISKKLREYEKLSIYCKYKKIIVIGLVVLWFALGLVLLN